MKIKKSDRILERLLLLHPKIIDLSLDRMFRILEKLGNPHKNLPPVIHVAGTNGKGSTIAYMRSILEAANLSVHVYTSPHLVRFAERIRLSGRLIEEDYLTDLLDHCEKINDGEPITYFEITTAAAFKAFADNRADILLLEVGLGGRLDATNVIDHPLATVITPISMDHEQYLGSTLRSIAVEKAGIAKRNCPLLIAAQLPEAKAAIIKTATEKAAMLIEDWEIKLQHERRFTYKDRHGEIEIPPPALMGPHQADNAALAIATLRHQNQIKLDIDHFKTGIESATWPARMQNISKSSFGMLLHKKSTLWLDGGHNPAAAAIIASCFPKTKLILILGMLKTKNLQEYLAKISSQTSQVFGIHIEGEDSYPATEIVKMAWAEDINAETADNVTDALNKIGSRKPYTVLVCGSLYLSGQVLKDNDLIPD